MRRGWQEAKMDELVGILGVVLYAIISSLGDFLMWWLILFGWDDTRKKKDEKEADKD